MIWRRRSHGSKPTRRQRLRLGSTYFGLQAALTIQAEIDRVEKLITKMQKRTAASTEVEAEDNVEEPGAHAVIAEVDGVKEPTHSACTCA